MMTDSLSDSNFSTVSTLYGFSLRPNLPAINIPNVKNVRMLSESPMKTVTDRATGKEPLVRAACTVKYRITPII
jgi:hypothetical protein